MNNILNIKNRKDLRKWFIKNHDKENEFFIELKRGEPKDDGNFYYLDAVEEALCFGWIDSTLKKINGKSYQRFTPRNKNGKWSELNKERCRRLVKLGLMTKAGEITLPDLNKKFVIDKDIKEILIKEDVYENFKKFPSLYQRIRIYNIMFYKDLDYDHYLKSLNHLIKETRNNKMFGQWSDYGRLL